MKGKSGPKLPPAGRGNPPPPIMASMEQGKAVGRLPDQGMFRKIIAKNFRLEIMLIFQGQSFLQQTNRQNAELNQLPQEAFPQSFDQKQPQNEKSQGFGSSGGGFGISLKSGQFN